MLNDFYSRLKSGTDIRGVATEGVPGENVNLTLDTCKNIINNDMFRDKFVSAYP